MSVHYKHNFQQNHILIIHFTLTKSADDEKFFPPSAYNRRKLFLVKTSTRRFQKMNFNMTKWKALLSFFSLFVDVLNMWDDEKFNIYFRSHVFKIFSCNLQDVKKLMNDNCWKNFNYEHNEENFIFVSRFQSLKINLKVKFTSSIQKFSLWAFWCQIRAKLFLYKRDQNRNHYNSLQSRWKMSLELVSLAFLPSLHLLSFPSFFTIKWIFKDFIIAQLVSGKDDMKGRKRNLWNGCTLNEMK